MLRWLILGAGGWGGNYVRATRALRGVRVVGYVDTNPQALRRLEADGVDAKLLSDDALEAIKRTAPDVISCSIPNPQRVPILVAAIEAAQAVIVDKPLAHTPAGVRTIVAAAARGRARICVAQDYRVKPGTQKVKALLEAGRAGRLSNATVQFIGNASFVGHTFYGGLDGPKAIGLEMGIHHFDMMRWLLGTEPRAVEARSWRPAWGYGRADTTLQALVEFGDELRATYAADWNSKAEHTSWNGRWIIAGERADVLWNDAPDGTVDVRLVRRGTKGPSEQRFSPKAKAYSMDVIIKAFADAVRTGGPLPVPLDDNVKSIGFALAAAES
jgi:predicted dehydrogenase